MPQYEDVYEPPILDATGQAIANAILGLNPPVPSFISDAFSVERSYSTGDIVIYENKVYVFTSDKSAGAWDSTKVTETTIGAICTATNASLMQFLTQLTTPIAITSSSHTISGVYYKFGDLVLAVGGYTATSTGAETVQTNLPSARQTIPIAFRDMTNGNLGQLYFDSNARIQTWNHTGNIAVGDTVGFCFIYATN